MAPKDESDSLILEKIEPIELWTEKLLWTGNAIITSDPLSFKLMVSLSDKADSVSWKEIPEALSIFDGGYDLLHEKERAGTLDEIIDFHNLVKCKCHYKKSERDVFATLRVPDQENLKTLDEIVLVSQSGNDSLPEKGSICVLEFDLFEQTYFLLSVLEDVEQDLQIYRLTEYFYQSNRRQGARIAVPESSINDIPGVHLLEVSDVGLKIRTTNRVETRIELEIAMAEIEFSIIYEKEIQGHYIYGLKLTKDTPTIRKAWQHFILKYQYPELKYRTQHDHEAFWDLYHRTGYMEFSYTRYLEEAKPRVLKTWESIDEIGPYLGGSIIASDNGHPVASIGVSRVGTGIYLTQAANTVAEPQFLQHTRDVYSWRTRFILQQPDTQFHLAFIHRDKVFLNRFFRSFYLKKNDNRILWDEWNLFVLKNTSPNTETENVAPDLSTPNTCALEGTSLTEYLYKIEPGNFKIRPQNDGHVVTAIPHLHMMQYMTGVWSKDACINPNNIFSKEHTFYSYYTKLETQSALEKLNRLQDPDFIVHEGWHVTWMCPQSLQNDFLKNSLKALEIMNRKYGPKSVA